MREPPSELSDDVVLATVRQHWRSDVDAVEHLPLGFGAHHWRASAGWRPELFVTYDRLGPTTHHDAASLEAAHLAARELAFTSDTVVAALSTDDLRHVVPVADGGLSVTPWVVGDRPPDDEPPQQRLDRALRLLARVHAARPPRALRPWQPAAPADLAEQIDDLLAAPWDAGPLGEDARSLVEAGRDDVRAWAARHRALVAAAGPSDVRPWVPTHGEPDERNQLLTPVRPLLVDWESVRLAPRERDLAALVRAGLGDLVTERCEPDVEMLELFDLDFRLDEVAQYVAWFAGPHDGGADDLVALDGLRDALTGPLP